MKFFLGVILSWSITITVVGSYWGKFALLKHVSSNSQLIQDKQFAEMQARYEVMISAYKKMCFIRDTYDKEVKHLMGQVEIHQRNMQERAKSREILAKALKGRDFGGVGGDPEIPFKEGDLTEKQGGFDQNFGADRKTGVKK